MTAKREPRHHPGNTLNDLTGRDWLQFTRTWFTAAAADDDLSPELADALQRFAAAVTEAVGEAPGELTPAELVTATRSWFIADSPRYWRNKATELHPARYPEEVVERFVRFFTQRGMWVLDPFAGSGATLVACQETGRHAVGLELTEKYAATAAGRRLPVETASVVIHGDARRTTAPGFWEPALAAGCPRHDGRPRFDFIICSPPYWNMLRTSRGGVLSTHRERGVRGLDTVYSEAAEDLGNLTDYDEFIDAVGSVFDDLRPCLAPGRYLVVILQNLRAPDGEVKTLAWDLCARLRRNWLFQGEQIWCQNTKKLGIWGYPKVFVPNYHHHYCLIFRRPAE